jgi:hypothetical protein
MTPGMNATLHADGFIDGLDAARTAVEALEALLAAHPDGHQAMNVYGRAFAEGFAQGFGRRLQELLKERRSLETERA